MAPSLKIFKILRFFKGFGRFWPRIGKKIQQKTQFPRHLFNSVSDCRFRDFRPFSTIAENHWPYTCPIVVHVYVYAGVCVGDGWRLIPRESYMDWISVWKL